MFKRQVRKTIQGTFEEPMRVKLHMVVHVEQTAVEQAYEW